MNLVGLTGVFNPRWQAEFNTSDGVTAWVNSTAAGIILMIGPIGSYIVDRCGCRWGTVIGSTIAMIGYVASSLAPSIPSKLQSQRCHQNFNSVT